MAIQTEIKKKSGVNLRLHACPRCSGSAYLESLDEDEWRCLQCGRTVPAPTAEKSASRAA